MAHSIQIVSKPEFGEYTPQDVLRMQRSPKARAFEEWYGRFSDMMSGKNNDRAVQAELEATQRALVELRDVVGTSPHVDATLSSLSIRFQNEDFIGTRLMPIASVPKQSDKYGVYNDRDYLAYPTSKVGPRGDVQELSTNIDLSNSYYCESNALQEYVDLMNIANADAPLDLLANATYKTNDGIEWNREKEIATILTNTASYGSNFFTISPGDEWDSASGGFPVQVIQDAVGNCLGGPGPTRLIGFCGWNVYKVLARHPEIRDLYKYTGSGLASPQLLAGTFGLDDLLVGKAWQDTANIGQTLVLDRIWGEIFGVVRVAAAPRPNSYSFGMTFDWMGKQTEVYFDRKKGQRGGYYVKVGDAWVPKVTAPRAGFLITNCLA